MGELVPTCCIETMPGDVFDIQVQNMLRFAPLLAPVMHRVNVSTHYYFVPYRILWANWEKFITGGETGEDASVMPTIQHGPTNYPEQGSLANHIGMPVDPPVSPMTVSALPFAAYYKVYDEYYRQQDVMDKIFQPLVDGDNTSNYSFCFANRPLRATWKHDYFTAALPQAQKGDAVQVPLVTQDDIPVELAGGTLPGGRVVEADGTLSPSGTLKSNVGVFSVDPGTGNETAIYDPNGSLVVDVQAGATDINTLRRAFRLQEWLERNARAGGRYIESILSHFGVRSSDARLQRPEYIGGAYQTMTISEVLSTAQTTDGDENTIPIGQMGGHGISVGGGQKFRYRCEEHGVIIGLITVRPDTAYQQGVHRMFSRQSKLDFAWPVFANIGEQEVANKEIYVASSNPSALFGYVPRFAEYKFMNSRVAGDFMTNLAFWHLGRKFDSEPGLNDEFLECKPRTDIFAFQGDADHIWAHIFNNIGALRKLPRYGTPQI